MLDILSAPEAFVEALENKDVTPAIKDQLLAEVVHRIEEESSLSAEDSSQRVARAIEERYTLPATGI